jgi:hypothetical protein
MNGIITHEESQQVTKAFLERQHNFFSNDLKECSGGIPERHLKGDCFQVIEAFERDNGKLDFVGFHPDCTYLTNAGIRWLSSTERRKGYTYSVRWSDFNGKNTYINFDRWQLMAKACIHFKRCLLYLRSVGKGYVENPRMHPYAMSIINEPSTQYIHPYYFGSPQMKETHLWIVGLPKLVATDMMVPPKDKRERLKWQDVWMASPGPKRAELRSKTDPKVAKAKAEQWG